MGESVFRCPVCGGGLDRFEKEYVCGGGHRFDISSYGHVNLLLSNQRHSANPGDDRGMIRARKEFLDKGYFSILRDELAALCLRHVGEGGAVLDSGCGEGYYTAGVGEAFRRVGRGVRLAGVDVSKYGVQLAARRGGGEFAVASAYNLPVGDGVLSLLWSCFSPVCLEGFFRVLGVGGVLVLVQPSARHLWGVKSILYDSPYENPPNFYEYGGFRGVGRYEVGGVVRICGGEDVGNLFRMTPYYWRTSVEGGERLRGVGEVETEIGFIIDVLEKR